MCNCSHREKERIYTAAAGGEELLSMMGCGVPVFTYVCMLLGCTLHVPSGLEAPECCNSDGVGADTCSYLRWHGGANARCRIGGHLTTKLMERTTRTTTNLGVRTERADSGKREAQAHNTGMKLAGTEVWVVDFVVCSSSKKYVPYPTVWVGFWQLHLEPLVRGTRAGESVSVYSE